MKRLIKLLFLILIVSCIAVFVVMTVSKRKFAGMSDDEIREFLAERIGDKLGPDQLMAVQTAVIGAVRGQTAPPTAHTDPTNEPTDEPDAGDPAT
ncbi:hypothetical protein MNBD_ACTINO02-913 [hydrothermal vent metagenome]|uniref:Uncharacterized protein n=1 Tax=hydrothermal vent metagenome TaxID=652676 RepID=A0A3B0SPW2_9ZZZZ